MGDTLFKLLATALAAALTFAAPAVLAADFGCTSPHQAVDQKGFIKIGGIEQWVTVKGDDCANPVVLFVHGGPGNPLSMYSDALYGAWGKRVTLVHWDQRGSGMTYGRSKPADGAALTVDLLREDGNAVAEWVAKTYRKPKVIAWGSSWGSILAVHMVKQRPELFYAYLGTSQLVAYEDQVISYRTLLELVRAAGDQPSLAVLEAVGPPPWTDPRSFGKVRKLTRKYEARVSTQAPSAWWKPPAMYTTPKAEADYEAGEDYSFLQFVGLNGDGMASTVDLRKLGTDFAVPVFLVEGKNDLVASPEAAQRWFDSIKAPSKGIVVLPRAGHDPNQAVIDAEYKMLVENILPLTR